MARTPAFKILYQQKDVTTELTLSCLSVSYTDNVTGKADEISLDFEDIDEKWRNEWYPTKGDKITLWMGYIEDGDLMPCGTFEIDEIDFQGPPDVVTIKGISAGIKKALRTPNSRALEKQSLREIAQAVADANGLELVDGTKYEVTGFNYTKEANILIDAAKRLRAAVAKGQLGISDIRIISNELLIGLSDMLHGIGLYDKARTAKQNLDLILNTAKGTTSIDTIGPMVIQFASLLEAYAESLDKTKYSKTLSKLDQVRIERVTQNRETDLGFLKRIAGEYGFAFSVRDNQLIFVAITDLEKADHVITINRTDCSRVSFNDKSMGTVKAAAVRYHSAENNEVVDVEVEAGSDSDSIDYSPETSDDKIELRVRAENPQQADIKAKAALHKANSDTVTCRLTLEGTRTLLAGLNIRCADGFGKFSGKYALTKSTHTITKSGGYATDVEGKKVAN